MNRPPINEDIKRLVEAASRMVEACECGLLNPSILANTRQALAAFTTKGMDQ